MAEPVLVPVGQIRQRLDNDDPAYVFSPDLYLTLALAYDSMAAPDAVRDANGVWQPRFDRMQPRLAQSWAEQPNGDWIVHLRPGVRSSAGHEWCAADVAWVFDKVMDQGVMAAWRWGGVVGVQGVDVVDQHTLRYRLRAPYPTFPNWLLSVSPNMVDSTEVSAHASPQDPYGIDWLNSHVAGYGAYVLESMDADRLIFAGRSDHWRGAPEADRVEVAVWADRSDAISQLDQDRPVVVVGLDPDETRAQLGRSRRRVVRTWAGHVSVEVDFTRPPFDDLRVRHALAFATPYEQVRSAGLLGLARPWTSPVKGISQWYDASPLPYTLDQTRARDLLRAAGLAGGFGSALYVDDSPVTRRIGELLARAWRQVGIEVELCDLGSAEPGWLPPLWVRTECAHNLSEPIYDLAHDYAAMNPLLPLPGGPPHVGGWHPRWQKNPAALEEFSAMLLDPDVDRKRARFDALQRHLVEASTSIFLAEGQQTMVANDLVPESLIEPGSRFYQAMQLQNCTSGYLPARR